MILERIVYFLYSQYSIYFRMAAYLSTYLSLCLPPSQSFSDSVAVISQLRTLGPRGPSRRRRQRASRAPPARRTQGGILGAQCLSLLETLFALILDKLYNIV